VKRSGSAMLIVIIIASALMTLAVIITKIVYNCYATEALIGQREQAFWLAEAGLELGKARLAQDPNWYTDLPQGPAVGERGVLPSGSFLMVRVKDQNILTATGYSGKAKVVLQISFGQSPVKTLTWSEL
jgi:type II secretory pathway component PulK